MTDENRLKPAPPPPSGGPAHPAGGRFGAVPKMVTPLLVMQPDSVQLIDEAMSRDRMIGMVFAKPDPAQEGPPKPESYAAVGTSAMILRCQDARKPHQLLVQGLGRFRIKKLILAEGKAFFQAEVEHLTEDATHNTEIEALMANIVNLFARVVQVSPTLPSKSSTWRSRSRRPEP